MVGRRTSLVLAIVVALSLVMPTIAFAKPTTEAQARLVVANWLKLDSIPLGARLGKTVGEVAVFKDDRDTPLYYVVYLQPSGFVILPADDLAEPIIAFAAQGRYDPSPPS